MKTARIFTLIIFALSFTAVVNGQDTIREVSRLYNLWHSATGVAAQGDYVYVSCGVPGLQVVDVSDLGNIDVVGSLELPCLTYDVVVSGNLAFVACYDTNAYIRIIDISEPANPIQIGVIDSLDRPDPYEGAAVDIAIEGDYLFVMTYSYIHVFDVSNPADPRLVNSFDFIDLSVYDIEISEHYIYFIPFRYQNEDYCIRVFDVSDPENIEEAGIFIYGEEIRDVAAQGNYAFATIDSGLLVIDVSEVEDMQVVTLLEFDDWRGNHIFLTDNFACVTARNGIYLIDISDPTQPDVCGVIEGLEGYPKDIAATDDMVYFTDRNNRLKIFDVTDISEPQEIWSFPPLGHILSVELRGNHAFLAAELGGLKVVDISNPEHPAEVGSCSFQGEASSLILDGDYAYIATGEEGLRILNISDPEDPFEVGCYDSSDVYDVAVVDDFAYLTGQSTYFSVLDISDPTEPALIDTCWVTFRNQLWNVAAAGNHLYLTDSWWSDWNIEGGNLNVYDISTPDEPELVGRLETEHFLKTVVVEDNIAYVYYLEGIGCQGPESAGILVVDVSEPSDPQLLAEYELEYANSWTNEVDDLVIAGDRLIVANSLKGLHFIDISNPEDPFESEYILTPGIAAGVAVFDHYTCVADYSNFGIYDCSGHFSVPYDEPDAPEFHTLLTAYPNPFNAIAIIKYQLPVRSTVSMKVFDLNGREVATLINGTVEAGHHQAVWNGRSAPSGIYICRIEGGSFKQTLKMTLIK